jgi:hypothetical protein
MFKSKITVRYPDTQPVNRQQIDDFSFKQPIQDLKNLYDSKTKITMIKDDEFVETSKLKLSRGVTNITITKSYDINANLKTAYTDLCKPNVPSYDEYVDESLCTEKDDLSFQLKTSTKETAETHIIIARLSQLNSKYLRVSLKDNHVYVGLSLGDTFPSHNWVEEEFFIPGVAIHSKQVKAHIDNDVLFVTIQKKGSKFSLWTRKK